MYMISGSTGRSTPKMVVWGINLRFWAKTPPPSLLFWGVGYDMPPLGVYQPTLSRSPPISSSQPTFGWCGIGLTNFDILCRIEVLGGYDTEGFTETKMRLCVTYWGVWGYDDRINAKKGDSV